MIIIYAHYSKTGHVGTVLATVEATLQQRQRAYEVWDLYQLQFNPVFNPETYDRTDAQGISADPQIKTWQEKIKQETDFIIIYPTWWVNVPAILKGFYDRVLQARFAFRYKSNGLPEGLLRGKRALVITTTGAPAFFHRLIKWNRSLSISTADTLRFCGIQTTTLLFGSCVHINETKRQRITKKTRATLERWLR